MAIKLICIDMDGTLLENHFDVHEDNIRAIKKALSKGVTVVIATGRMFTSARYFSSILKIDTPIIAGNGTYIKERHSDKVIAKYTMGKKLLLEISEIAEKYDLGYRFFSSDEIIVSRKYLNDMELDLINDRLPEEQKIKINIYEDMNDAICENHEDILSCSIVERGDKDALEKCRRELKEKISDAEIVSSWEDNIEIMKKGISKGDAVKTIAKMYKINREEIMCIGDNENDLSMIEFAGIGVAMGNAIDLLKEKADYVTTENTQGGVAKAIEKFVFNT